MVFFLTFFECFVFVFLFCLFQIHQNFSKKISFSFSTDSLLLFSVIIFGVLWILNWVFNLFNL